MRFCKGTWFVDMPHSNNGMRDDTKRTVVVLRSVACAKSMSCVFFAVCGHVSTLLVSSFCMSSFW